MTTRISQWAREFGLQIVPAESTPIARGSPFVLRVVDLFTTTDGSWEVSDKPGSVPQWARDAYLKPWGAPDYFDDAGGAVHLFGLVLDESGHPIKTGHLMRFWSDGYAKLGDSAYTGFVLVRPKPQHGWANLAMTTGDSAYSPPNRGPWCWFPDTSGEFDADVVTGGGLWRREHKSVFGVWQRMPATAGVDPPIEPPVGADLVARVAALEAWARSFPRE